MARPTLKTHRKFARLTALVAEHLPRQAQWCAAPLCLGMLERIWSNAYESGNPVLGDSLDVETAAGWGGPRGALTKALATAGGLGRAGFIVRNDAAAGGNDVVDDAIWCDAGLQNDAVWCIHDFWHHAPDYVKRRRSREIERETNGDRLKASHVKSTTYAESPVSDRSVTGQRSVSDRAMVPTPAPAPAPAPALNKSQEGMQGKPKPAADGTVAAPATSPAVAPVGAPRVGSAAPPLKLVVPAADLEAEFVQFWAAYPRKVGKGAARKAYTKARTKSGLSSLTVALAALTTARRQPQWLKDEQYIPHAATWLNGERWNDEPGAAKLKAPPPQQDRTFVERRAYTGLRALLTERMADSLRLETEDGVREDLGLLGRPWPDDRAAMQLLAGELAASMDTRRTV